MRARIQGGEVRGLWEGRSEVPEVMVEALGKWMRIGTEGARDGARD